MQKRIKRIFALICAFTLLATTVFGNGVMRQAKAAEPQEAVPVTLDGYTNVTIKDFSKDGTQMPEGEYPCTDATNGNNSVYSLTDGSSVNGKLLSMKVTFTQGGGSAERLDVAGSGEWKGFMVYPSGDGSYLYLVSNAYGTTDGWQHGEIKASDVGVSSFLNDEFILQLAFDFGTADGNNKADVTVKAYIDGTFAIEHVFTGCNMANLGGYMSAYRQAEGAVITVKSVEWPTEDEPSGVTPVTLDGYTNVTIKDFSKDGTQMPEGEYPCTDATYGNNSVYSLTDGSSVNGKLLSMKVTFTQGGGSAERLDVAGSGEWKGFMVYPSGDGSYLYLVSNAYGTTDGWQHGEIKASDVGVSSFLNDEFILQLAFDFGTADGNNKADVTVKAYIDGTFAIEHVFTGCNMANLGGYMSAYRQAEGAVITVKSVEWPTEEEPDTPDEPSGVTPITLDGYTNVTIKDFSKDGTQMPEGEYPCTDATNGNNSVYSLTDGSSVNGKLLSMKVTFTQGGGSAERLDVAGSGEWKGFMVYPSGDGSYLYLVSNAYGTTDGWQHGEIKASDVGVSSFLNDEFILQLAFDFGTADGNNKADVTVKAYIDGTFAIEHVFTGCNMANLGGYMSAYRQAEGAVITVKSVEWPTEEEPDTPVVPTLPSTSAALEGYTKVVVGDLVDASGNPMEEKTYTGRADGAYDTFSWKNGTSFDKTVLSMNVKFAGGGGNARFDVAGAGGWSGYSVYTSANGQYLHIYTNYNVANPAVGIDMSATTAGVDSFLNKTFLLELSMDFVDADNDNLEDDLQVGVYINGNLYGNVAQMIPNCDLTKFGNCVSLYREGTDKEITIGAESVVTPIVPNEDLEKVTFSHFGIDSDEYNYNGDLVVQGPLNGKDSVAGTVLCGDVELSGSGHFQLILGGGENAWDGIRLVSDNADALHVWWYEGTNGTHITSFYSNDAGVSFQNENITIMISTEIVDNDIKLGVWFNGVLYNNEYVIIEGKADKLANKFAAYCANESASVILTSDPELKGDDEPDTPDEPAEIVPVELEGFDNLTLKDFTDGSGNVMEAGEYNSGVSDTATSSINKHYSVNGLANFDNKLLSMKVKFSNASYKNSVVIGGAGEWKGFNIHAASNGAQLLIDNSWAGSIVALTPITMDASIAEVDTFLNEEFLLQISFEYGEEVNGKADLTMGVYINGKLYNNQAFTIEDCDMSNSGSGLALYVEEHSEAATIITVDNVVLGEDTPDIPDTPIVPNEELEKITFSNFGIIDDVYPYVDGDLCIQNYLQDKTSMAQTLFDGDITFNESGHFQMIFGGVNGAWDGLRVIIENNNEINLYWYQGSNGQHVGYTNADIIGTTFIGQKLNVKLSMEVVDNDLKAGLWINDVAATDDFIMIEGAGTQLGNMFGVYCSYEDASVTIGEGRQEPDEPTEIVPVELEGFDNLTLKDFTDGSGNVMEAGEYNSGVSADATSSINKHYSVRGLTNFDNKLLSMKVKFSNASYKNSVVIGGAGEWKGFNIHAASNGAQLVIDNSWAGSIAALTPITMDASIAEVDTFLNEEFLLQISFEYGEEVNGKADLTLGVYINGKLYNNQTFTIEDCDMSNSGSGLALYVEEHSEAATIITVDNVVLDEDTPDEPGESEQPNPDLEKVTFSQYGIAEGGYLFTGDLVVQGALKDKDSIAGTVLCGDIELAGSGHFQVILGGGDNAWDGIRLVSDNAEALHVWWYEGTNGTHITSFYSADAGVSFQNENITIMISTENVDNDIKLGVWFNDVLYNNEYVIIEGKADKLANKFAAYCANESASVILTPDPELKGDDEPIIPDEPQQPNEEFEKITFAHFGVKDGTYPYNGDIVLRGALKGRDTLDQTVICGDVLLDGSMGFQLLFGGKEDTWDGLRLIVANADNMHLYWFNDDGANYLTTYTSVVAGTAFVGEQFNLMVSTEVIGEDIQFGIWFNGVLYNNQYVTFEGFADELGNMFGAYCEGTDASVTLNSIPELMPPVEPPKKPNPDFERITFDYFGLKDGTYKYDGTDAPTFEGKGSESLDEKVLCGDVLFSGKGENHFMVGGNGNTWYAFRFVTQENGTIVLYWIDDAGLQLVEIFDAMAAGATLVGEWLNLMISTEVLDADGDGAEDDIELGVWFNGVLYKEQYYTILDKASGLGSQFGFDCMGEDNAISIRSIPEFVRGFNYEAYGLTKDWEKTLLTDHKTGTAVGGSRDAEPFAGDLLEISTVCVLGATVVAAMLVGAYTIVRRKKES